ncbi:MAG: hypothetical protein SNG27_07660 [Rikenellaceae bacterium]
MNTQHQQISSAINASRAVRNLSDYAIGKLHQFISEEFDKIDLPEDGDSVEYDFNVYNIQAVREYSSHFEIGGDSYCGVHDLVEVVDVHKIIFTSAWDTIDDCECPTIVSRLNSLHSNQTLN